MVGIDVGSGYDVNARLLARHLANHIPGKPTIVVQNQPGAGSAIMTSQLYTQGPFDGTVIGAAFAGMPTQPLLQPGSGIRFDPVKLLWLGNTNRETHVTYVWHTSPVQSLDEVKSKQLIMGAQAPGSSQVDFPLVANALLSHHPPRCAIEQARGRSSMVERKLPKLHTRVRFPSPAPRHHDRPFAVR